MKFRKAKSGIFTNKIGFYYEYELKTLVFLFKRNRYYIFF